MRRSKSFNIIDAVRFDMYLHGGRFIIWEFVIASIIVAAVVVASIIHYFSSNLSFFGCLWIFTFIGILINCMVIAMLAIRISKKEGNRPETIEKVNPKILAVMFTVYILTPYLLSFKTCQQIEKA